MRFLVVSDIHGRYERLAKLIDQQKGIDALIFLGDGRRDIENTELDGIPLFSVTGKLEFLS